MKKMCCVLFCIIYSFLSLAQGSSFEIVTEAVSKMGPCWNLASSFDVASYEPERPQFNYAPGFMSDLETYEWCPVVKPELITLLAQSGFSGIRLDVAWGYMMDPKTFEIRRDLLDRVQQVVDYILANNLYCILNSMDNGINRVANISYDDYVGTSKPIRTIWKQVAERFKDYGQNLLFEALNEPVNNLDQWGDDVSDNDLRALNMFFQDFVDIVRNSGGNNRYRNLVVTIYTGQGTNERFYKAFEMPKDIAAGHIMSSIHAYSDFSWADCKYDSCNQNDIDNISTCLRLSNEYFVKKGIPCIVGEMGSEARYIWNGKEDVLVENEEQRAEYIGFVTKEAAQYGMPCFIWPGIFHNGEDRGIPKITFPKAMKALVDNSPIVGRAQWNSSGR